jgi:hypothetical protein
VTLVRPFAARLRKTADTLWPWDDEAFAAGEVDPVIDELTDRHLGIPSSVRNDCGFGTDCMKQNSLQTLTVV